MKSIVINDCFGGFCISEAGIMRYAEIKGLKVYSEAPKRFGSIMPPTYWIVPPDCDIPRDDPALVRVVEELGQEAAGMCAHLKVVKIPDGVAWEIEEYDGKEHVAQVHETWS